LTVARFIPKPPAGWPDCVRYHPRLRALIVCCTDEAGRVAGVQCVFLTPDCKKEFRKVDGSTKPIAKQTHGRLGANPARLPGPVAGPILFAEGPETALSAWIATGYETHFGFGCAHMGNLVPPAGRLTIVCRDDDPSHLQTGPEKSVNTAVHKWHAAGMNVAEVYPWAKRKQNKGDFNDLLQSDGAAAVRDRINSVIATVESRKPEPIHRISAEQARPLIRQHVGGFFDVARLGRFIPRARDDEQPPGVVRLIKSTVGSAKSSAVRDFAVRFIIDLRERGDIGVVVILVPNLRLGQEQVEKIAELQTARSAGIIAMQWRGREAPNPSAPDQTMCRNINAVKDVQAVAGDVEKMVCKNEEAECPFFRGCAYLAQHEAKVDIYFAAHQIGFSPKPAGIPEVAALVVDESCHQAALVGTNPTRADQLTIDEVGRTISCQTGRDDTAWLQNMRGKLAFCLRSHPSGPVTRAALVAEGFTPDMALRAKALEWLRKIEPEFRPDMTKRAWEKAKADAAGNRTISRFAWVWSTIHDILTGEIDESGRLTMADDLTRDGAVRVLQIRGMRKIGKGFAGANTLIVDATAEIQIVKTIWPAAETTAEIDIAAPHQRVFQVVNRAFTEEDVLSGIERWRSFIVRMAKRYAPGNVLVIVQKEVELTLKSFGNLPFNVEIDHFNNIKGIDRWKDVAAEIIIGRTLPGSQSVEGTAAALSGRHIPPSLTATGRNWYETVSGYREMADGSFIPAKVLRHPDSLANAVMRSTCQGEILQAAGRVRGINRTAQNPVDLWILTDVDLPLPIDEILLVDDLEPTATELMLETGGIAFESAAFAAKYYPELFEGLEEAKYALRAEKLGKTRKRYILLTKIPQLLRATFKPVGQGRSISTATFDPVMLPAMLSNPCAWLSDRLGVPVAWVAYANPSENQELSAPPAAAQRIALIEKDSTMSTVTETEQQGVDPATIYKSPMTEAPPAGVWRLGNGDYIEESRSLKLAPPSTNLSGGWVTVHSAEHPDKPVSMRWGETEFYRHASDARRVPFGLLIAAWGADASTWQAEKTRQPDELRPVVNRWVEQNGPRGAPVARSDQDAAPIQARMLPSSLARVDASRRVRIDPVTMERHLVYDPAVAA
jgi:putative DNA primase/helicase